MKKSDKRPQDVVAGIMDDAPPPPKNPEEDLPVVETIGIQKVSKGYVCLSVRVQGSRVVGTDVLSKGPGRRVEAENIFRVECFKRGILTS